MATNDWNSPEFFTTRNMDALATDATFSDYGPGPNETLEAALESSAAIRMGMRGQQVDDGWTPPPPMREATAPSSDVVDQLADAVLARVMDKLNNK